MNYLPTCTSRLVVKHPCQVSSKSMKGCRRSWEDKLKCVKILSVKDHNSAKICRTRIISPHALLDLWCNIPAKFHSNPCKDVGGVEKTNFDGTEGRNDGRTEWRNDGMTEWRTKQTLNAPLPFYGGGIKICHSEIFTECTFQYDFLVIECHLGINLSIICLFVPLSITLAFTRKTSLSKARKYALEMYYRGNFNIRVSYSTAFVPPTLTAFISPLYSLKWKNKRASLSQHCMNP